MKNIINKLFIFILLISIFTSNIVFASEGENISRSIRCDAYLTNLKTGTVYRIKSSKLPEMRSIENSSDKEIVFLIEPNKSNILGKYSSRAGGSQENEEVDVSDSVRGVVKIKYASRYNSKLEEEEYLLKNISGSWKVIEPRGIKLSNRRVAYTCQDAFNLKAVKFRKPSSNSFNYASGFRKWINSTNGGVLGATSRVIIQHGSESEWEFVIECNCFDNNILDLLGPDGFK